MTASAPFSSPTPIAAGTPQSCPLVPGKFNLVGDPFLTDALLPAGKTAQYYNNATGTYITVNRIPAGGSVYYYAQPGETSLTLTAT